MATAFCGRGVPIPSLAILSLLQGKRRNGTVAADISFAVVHKRAERPAQNYLQNVDRSNPLQCRAPSPQSTPTRLLDLSASKILTSTIFPLKIDRKSTEESPITSHQSLITSPPLTSRLRSSFSHRP